MLNTEYAIRQFELYQYDSNKTLLYTPEISASIVNKHLFDLLDEIHTKQLDLIDDEKLNALIQKYTFEVTDIKGYLINELKLLSPLRSVRFKKLFLIMDNEIIENNLKNQFERGFGVEIFGRDGLSSLDQDSFMLVAQMAHHQQEISDLYAQVKKNNAWIITSYVVHHYLMIDNLYQHQMGVPCHFCNYHRYQQVVSSPNGLRNTSWINFYRRLLQENIRAVPAIRVDQSQLGLITFWLGKTIDNYLSPHGFTLFFDDVGQSTLVNLTTGQTHQEHAAHWAFCHCLNG